MSRMMEPTSVRRKAGLSFCVCPIPTARHAGMGGSERRSSTVERRRRPPAKRTSAAQRRSHRMEEGHKVCNCRGHPLQHGCGRGPARRHRGRRWCWWRPCCCAVHRHQLPRLNANRTGVVHRGCPRQEPLGPGCFGQRQKKRHGLGHALFVFRQSLQLRGHLRHRHRPARRRHQPLHFSCQCPNNTPRYANDNAPSGCKWSNPCAKNKNVLFI
jgi:hypothetical protein